MSIDQPFKDRAYFDERSFRDDSEQAQEFLVREFSSMHSELSQVFSHERPPLRFVPLIWRMARDLAPLYVRAPAREFSGVDATTAAQLERTYQRIGFDAIMRNCSRQAVVHHTQVVSCDPVGPEDVALRVWSPFEVAVEFSDPLEEDIRKADKVKLRIPLSNEDGQVEYGCRVYTQDLAVVTDMDGTTPIRGIFNDAGTNPFNGIPLRAYRSEQAFKGFWFPPIAQDMLSVQIGLNLVLSFVEHIGRHQGFTQRTLTGSGAKTAAENAWTGPEYVMAMDGDEMVLDVHDPNPPTDKTLSALDTTMRLFGASNLVDVQSLLSKSTGITGDAKAMEMHDREEAKRELELDFVAFEGEVAQLVLETMRHSGLPRADAESVSVELDFRYVEPKRNDLQMVQALEARYNLGLDSRAKTIAREQGVGLEAADRILAENIAEGARLLLDGSPVPPPVASEGDNNVPGA